MAQTKSTSKKKGTAKGSSTKAASPKRSAPVSEPEPIVPMRREVGGVISLFIALVIAIGYFKAEGSFILFVADLLKGLLGWGYYLAAPAMLLVSVILFFHRGRPVSLRIFCAMLLPVLFAAFISLLRYQMPEGKADIGMTAGILFEEGQELISAGLFGGMLAWLLQSTITNYGAFPVLLVGIVACIFCAFKFNYRKAAEQVRIRATAPYDPSMYDDSLVPITGMKKQPKTAGQDAAAVAAAAAVPAAVKPGRRAAPSPLDIPFGDEPEDDEDALSLIDGTATQTKPHTAQPRKRSAEVKIIDAPAETKDVEPLSPELAAKIAGVTLQEPQTERPVRKTAVRVSAGEISDPPKKKAIRAQVEQEAKAVEAAITCSEPDGEYVYPPTDLLRAGVTASGDYREEIAVNRERLEGAIQSFGISANIVSVTRGPTVTRYDIELDRGVKLSRVTNLAGDLALALGVVNVRIAPIPDRISTVGIEVPNKIVSTVYLRDIIESPKFVSARSRLSFAVGKDIGGEEIVGNIAKLPHMLIAGTTGSGKSVCMNCLILSLLFKATPEEVRLIMIDPKMVELGVYNGIPHLYVPVVTDPKKAAGALQWSVVEMLKRYRMMSEASVRDLESYNKICRSKGEPILPQVVVVIDELADLMLVASKEVEESICRVAQMGRAAGIHLIIATQRPSADVITGLMKANIPSRIAFAVSSSLESRIILDQSGAEKLIGMGDMLFSPVGCGKPTRVQGAFVSDDEREEVIQFIKESAGVTAENSEIEEFMNKAVEDKKSGDSKGSKNGGDDEDPMGDYDDMLPKAVEAVLEMNSCSVSALQRRVKLGYSRAARIVDQMEELGIVGPYEGAKPRAVIIDREGWNRLQVQLGMASESDFPELAAEDPAPDDFDNFDSDN